MFKSCLSNLTATKETAIELSNYESDNYLNLISPMTYFNSTSLQDNIEINFEIEVFDDRSDSFSSFQSLSSLSIYSLPTT